MVLRRLPEEDIHSNEVVGNSLLDFKDFVEWDRWVELTGSEEDLIERLQSQASALRLDPNNMYIYSYDSESQMEGLPCLTDLNGFLRVTILQQLNSLSRECQTYCYVLALDEQRRERLIDDLTCIATRKIQQGLVDPYKLYVSHPYYQQGYGWGILSENETDILMAELYGDSDDWDDSNGSETFGEVWSRVERELKNSFRSDQPLHERLPQGGVDSFYVRGFVLEILGVELGFPDNVSFVLFMPPSSGDPVRSVDVCLYERGDNINVKEIWHISFLKEGGVEITSVPLSNIGLS
ncbi:hypothetical protein HN748_06060 [Candidatus Peregrinibacteria bacterium]|jgi:hypothetical protein|nr:hypothetical protein [Candidatus Peregrinibacteria bacterium]MBT7484207.1 hypothetical protein [Candidatus Peregrinibacteria bacterium]MBT7703770.1 hypothetical protein [Candidatus Peregrinibacteria bacterium]